MSQTRRRELAGAVSAGSPGCRTAHGASPSAVRPTRRPKVGLGNPLNLGSKAVRRFAGRELVYIYFSIMFLTSLSTAYLGLASDALPHPPAAQGSAAQDSAEPTLGNAAVPPGGSGGRGSLGTALYPRSSRVLQERGALPQDPDTPRLREGPEHGGDGRTRGRNSRSDHVCSTFQAPRILARSLRTLPLVPTRRGGHQPAFALCPVAWRCHCC